MASELTDKEAIVIDAAEYAKLEAALRKFAKAILEAQDRGACRTTDEARDYFACLFCGAQHLEYPNIRHDDGCIVLKARKEAAV